MPMSALPTSKGFRHVTSVKRSSNGFDRRDFVRLAAGSAVAAGLALPPAASASTASTRS
ncbi:MAG: hypothetical protein H6Q02_2643 [Acidobacteria bacterium]|nr:hypothetical protein [Acidobacteriota bacterium]